MAELMCEMCYIGWREVDTWGDKFSICESPDGRWHVLMSPWHNEDIAITFHKEPWMDPCYGLTDEQIDAMPEDEFDKEMDWVVDADDFEEFLGIQEGAKFLAEIEPYMDWNKEELPVFTQALFHCLGMMYVQPVTVPLP